MTSGIETEYTPVAEKDIPKVLQQEQLQPQPVAAQVGWDSKSIEAIIQTIAAIVSIKSKKAADILSNRKEYLGAATAPLLDKYVKTQFGVEINCALAWAMVSMEIVWEIKKEQEAKKNAANVIGIAKE